ncbi:MAG: hypothetical protein ACXVFK_13015 [Solirubrobacteraceae bacterium]
MRTMAVAVLAGALALALASAAAAADPGRWTQASTTTMPLY